MNSNNKPPSRQILAVNNLTKIFRSAEFFSGNDTEKCAVNNISFELQEGKIVGLLGPNGAGKSTTINMLLGTLKPTSGTISYFGKDFAYHRSEILQYVGFASGSIQLPTVLTVWQNLDVHARLYGLSVAEKNFKIESLLKTFHVWNMRNMQTAHLSSGQLNRVMLAKAFLTNPRIIFLDEVTAGLDPDMATIAQDFFLEQRRRSGTTIVLTSHNLSEVTKICDYFLIMKDGNITQHKNMRESDYSAHDILLSLKGPDKQKLQNILLQLHLKHSAQEDAIVIEIRESKVAELLAKLACENIYYTHISIDKKLPTNQFLQFIGKTQSL